MIYLTGGYLMEIKELREQQKLTLFLDGRLDLTSAPQLDAVIKSSLTDVRELVLDFEKLEYISSAGLRVLLAAQKIMKTQGRMTVRNVNDTVRDVFDITGFCDILTVE